MTKAEIKAASNEDLIMELVRMMLSNSILKSHKTTAKQISKEMETRRIVTDAESMYGRWDTLYTM